MGARSDIEWTDATWNPTRGCTRVSSGCQRCYAERMARRLAGPGKPYEGLLHSTGAWNGTVVLAREHLLDPLHWALPCFVFVDSMSDLFHEDVPFSYIDKVFAVMSITTRHTYQILTKRPQRMIEYFRHLRWGVGLLDDEPEGWDWDYEVRMNRGERTSGLPDQIRPSEIWKPWKPQHHARQGGYDNCGPLWPLENVLLGVSCEDQEQADERLRLLLQVPAALYWASCEPLLEEIDIHAFLHTRNALPGARSLGWVVAGAESGPGARPCNLDWIRSLRDQCQSESVPFFYKQHFEKGRKIRTPELDGRRWIEWPKERA